METWCSFTGNWTLLCLPRLAQSRREGWVFPWPPPLLADSSLSHLLKTPTSLEAHALQLHHPLSSTPPPSPTHQAPNSSSSSSFMPDVRTWLLHWLPSVLPLNSLLVREHSWSVWRAPSPPTAPLIPSNVRPSIPSTHPCPSSCLSRLTANDHRPSGFIIPSIPLCDHVLLGQLAPLQPSSTPQAPPSLRPKHSVSGNMEPARHRWLTQERPRWRESHERTEEQADWGNQPEPGQLLGTRNNLKRQRRGSTEPSKS